MPVSCFLAQEILTCFVLFEEKEQHVFCSVLVMFIVRATPWPFESVPSNLNSYVEFFRGKPAISTKGISCPVHTLF